MLKLKPTLAQHKVKAQEFFFRCMVPNTILLKITSAILIAQSVTSGDGPSLFWSSPSSSAQTGANFTFSLSRSIKAKFASLVDVDLPDSVAAFERQCPASSFSREWRKPGKDNQLLGNRFSTPAWK